MFFLRSALPVRLAPHHAPHRRAEDTMKASIAGRVSHTNLPKAKALLPVFEAVVNAFQAIGATATGGSHFRDGAAGRQMMPRRGVQPRATTGRETPASASFSACTIACDA